VIFLFKTSGIVTGKDFVDREGELKELAEGIKKNNYILTGPRRIGKSSLLAELERRLNKKFIVTNFSVSEVVPRTHENFLNLLAKRILATHLAGKGLPANEVIRTGFRELMELLSKLRFNVLDLVTVYFKPEVNVSELLNATFELPERLAVESGVDHLIMLDELPLLVRMPGGKLHEDDVNFMWSLREKMQKAKRTHFIISGSQVGMIKKLSFKEDSPFFGTFIVRTLKGIDEKSAVRLLSRVKRKVKVENKLINRVVRFTNGIPLYLASFGNAMLVLGKQRRLREKDFQTLMEKTFLDLKPQFEEVLGKITSSFQREILEVMALNDTNSASKVRKFLHKPYQAVYVNMERLEVLGYLDKTGKGEFQFSDPLLKEYLRLKTRA